MRRFLLEALACVVGVGVLVGEAIEPAPAQADDGGGGDEFPSQRRGGGTHFRERIERAKLLGKLPGLRKMAAKLREPRSSSVLAAYTPPDDSQGSGGSNTGGGIRGGGKAADEPMGPDQTPPLKKGKDGNGGDEFPSQRRGGGTH